MTCWQIAAGSLGRDYSEKFILFGMAFVGGDQPIETMEQVSLGDRIILKRGTKKIIAVGEVVSRNGKHKGCSDKEWLRDFDGWDVEAYCFVKWHRPENVAVTHGLTRATIQRVNKEHLLSLAKDIFNSAPAAAAPLPDPPKVDEVTDSEILSFLITEGLRPSTAEELTIALSRIRLLARHYYGFDDRSLVREHETRTFLVIPLLIALGWAEQQIKIELPVSNNGRVDVACFNRPYFKEADDRDCVLLIETKGFSQGLDYAPDQARSYAEHFPKCQVVLVTNGFCYKAYTRSEGQEFSLDPKAYLNLMKPRSAYPIDPENVAGCLDTLKLLPCLSG